MAMNIIVELRSVERTGSCTGTNRQAGAKAAYLETVGLVYRSGVNWRQDGRLVSSWLLTQEGRGWLADNPVEGES